MPYVAPGPKDEGDLLTGKRTCRVCEVRQPMENFHWANRKRSRRRSCKTCDHARNRDTRNKRPEHYKQLSRDFHLRKHGLTQEKYDQMLEQQGWKCAGCWKPLEKASTHIDHDHSCCPGDHGCPKCVRGLLCRKCNLALGLLHDDVLTLSNLLTYIRKNREDA